MTRSLFRSVGMFTAGGMAASRVGRTMDASVPASQPSSTAMKERMRRLEENMGRTLLICEALWEMLEEAAGVTELQLLHKVEEIDLRDGVKDGKNKGQPGSCPECGRVVSPRHENCIYCGREFERSIFTMR